MSLSIGIVGLPNVGKSTLFTALTKQGGLAANYPFATIDPNKGIVDVPDDRLGKLAEIVEIKDHPFFVACQFHPEFLSKPNHPHPIFFGFVKAAMGKH